MTPLTPCTKSSQFETLKKFIVIGLTIFFSLSSMAADTTPETEPDASYALTNLKDDLNNLKYFAERVDLGRILVLERKVDETNALVQSKGLGNLETLNSYQQLVLSFQYSDAFMKSISTKMNTSTVASIGQKLDQIIKARGFDQSMNSQLVAGILNQVYNLTQQIQGQEISGSLLEWMKKDLSVQLGSAIATARANGDVPASFQAANTIYSSVTSHYSELGQINSKNAAYNMVTELMGLMEFYKEMATRGLHN